MPERARSAREVPEADLRRPGAVDVVDAVVGVVAASVSTAGRASRPARAVARPLVGFALRPPLVPAAAQPATWMHAAARRGASLRVAVTSELAVRIDAALPVVAQALEGHADLTDIVTEHVDLVSVAQDLVTELDLPEIIRGSSSAVVSETVLGVRLRSVSADEALARATARVRSRFAGRARP